MKMKETKKKNKEWKVLAAAAVVTAITVAGSTFAWLSSKDEVTNRLAVKSSYRTAIYETDFNPPTNWEIGQTIDKNVSIVNSGNIDAIVKVTLDGDASMTYWTSAETTNEPNDNEYRKLNIAEVTAIEAGGRLVTTTVAGQDYSNCSTADPYEFTISNSTTAGTFTEKGYYIFKRSDETETYSGYYCDGNGAYYALYTEVDTSTGTENTVISLKLYGVSVSDNQITGYKLMKKQTTSDPVAFEYDYSAVATDKKITVTLTDKNGVSLAVFEIALDNIGNGAAQWTYISDKGFYYNNDLESESGKDLTSKLVDSVKFVRANAYFENIVYNLNISHESVQVVVGDNNKECLPGTETGDTAVEPFGDGVTAQAMYSAGGTEIDSITWAAASTTP